MLARYIAIAVAGVLAYQVAVAGQRPGSDEFMGARLIAAVFGST